MSFVIEGMFTRNISSYVSYYHRFWKKKVTCNQTLIVQLKQILETSIY